MARSAVDGLAIDLNADVGEGFPEDTTLIPLVTSVNVACGAHAGDRATIARTIELAASAGAAIGAHPSYPDPEHFGRREIDLPADELLATLTDQIRLVVDVATAAGVPIRHVKPHGALYNRSARDPHVAAVVAGAVRGVSPDLILVGLAGSASLDAARAAGLETAAEAFADRAYEPNGRLRDRRHADAVLDDPEAVGQQALGLARDGRVTAVDGSTVLVAADTICVHGDIAGATERARAARAALEAAGFRLRPLKP